MTKPKAKNKTLVESPSHPPMLVDSRTYEDGGEPPIIDFEAGIAFAKSRMAVETILEEPPEPVTEEDVSELEVQQMLEARDNSGDPQGPLAAPPEPEQPPAVPSAPTGPHALDLAGISSKIVVTEEGAFLATPDGVNKLPKTDAANKLPVGARIQKKAEMLFRSEQLSPAEDHPAQTYESAREAIQNFVNDFHPSGLHN